MISIKKIIVYFFLLSILIPFAHAHPNLISNITFDEEARDTWINKYDVKDYVFESYGDDGDLFDTEYNFSAILDKAIKLNETYLIFNTSYYLHKNNNLTIIVVYKPFIDLYEIKDYSLLKTFNYNDYYGYHFFVGLDDEYHVPCVELGGTVSGIILCDYTHLSENWFISAVTITHDMNNLLVKFYNNGTLTIQYNYSMELGDIKTEENLTIGLGESGYKSYIGLIDNVLLFNTSLSDEETKYYSNISYTPPSTTTSTTSTTTSTTDTTTTSTTDTTTTSTTDTTTTSTTMPDAYDYSVFRFEHNLNNSAYKIKICNNSDCLYTDFNKDINLSPSSDYNAYIMYNELMPYTENRNNWLFVFIDYLHEYNVAISLFFFAFFVFILWFIVRILI